MGYTTDFYGAVEVSPPLNADEISFLKDLAETRRMIRTKGPLFVRGSGFMGQGNDGDVLNHNSSNGAAYYGFGEDFRKSEHYEPDGQPSLWLQWVPTDDGTAIEWDGGEKFYSAAEWMKYLVTKLLAPSGREYVAKHREASGDERLDSFTFDHVVNGQIDAQGEDHDDRWTLVVKDNVVMVAETETRALDPKPV